MKLYAKGSFTGNYEPFGQRERAGCLVADEYATHVPLKEYGIVNIALAQFIAQESLTDLPLMLNRNIAGALSEIDPGINPTLIFEGESTNTTASKGQGTYGELLQAKEYMDANGLEVPIIVAQAYHVGRVALQAKHVGIKDFVILPGLPKIFDPESDQRWTRNRGFWSLRELVGVPVLKHRDQI
jgi:hypothetical protein